MQELIEIVPYDPDWTRSFLEERARLAAALGPLAVRIEHHGSTSVPGLPAKPIVDIQISVERLHPIEPYALPLAHLHYVHVPHPDDAFCPFFHRPATDPHTHHVHVVQAGGEEERRTLAFRNYLREHSDTAQEYADLKHRLASRHLASEQQAYAEAKTEFVVRITEIALSEGYPLEISSGTKIV